MRAGCPLVLLAVGCFAVLADSLGQTQRAELLHRLVFVRGQLVAGKATVVLVGYPDLLPATGSGCWPRMPLTRSDVPYLRSTEGELNAMLSTVAAANGATFVSTSTQSASHTTCAARSTRWVEPLVPTNLAAPVHPNARGEAGMAAVVAGALQRLGVA